jgi:hypothetical protein
MKSRFVYSSMTRIANLGTVPFSVEPLPRHRWATADYVVAEVNFTASDHRVELTSGRMIEVAEGDLIIGALGKRSATLSATGSWEEIGDDGQMAALTSGGLLGKALSRSPLISPLMTLTYRGHVVRDGASVRMSDFIREVPSRPYTLPTVMLFGTSMSAGKTTAARIITRVLKREGLRVLGAKLTGAGRYRDVLSMYDAGADVIFDFVDAGLPSTICDDALYRSRLRGLLSRMASAEVDVGVIEIGASPMEPYNGAAAIAEIDHSIRFSVLCASDPYAVVGVQEAFGRSPDIVTGIATNTEAGVALVEQLADLPAFNLRNKDTLPLLRRHLLGALCIAPAAEAKEG